MTISEKVALQQVILPVLVATPSGGLIHLGSAFVIAVLGRQALLMTAAHVLQEAVRLDENRPKHHPSALPEFVDSAIKKQLRHTGKVYVAYRESEGQSHLACAGQTYINDPSDIALLAVEFASDIPDNVNFRSRLTLDSSPPVIDTPIISAGYGDSKMDHSSDPKTGLSSARFHHTLDYRHGQVTELLGREDPSFSFGPGFRINTAISSGMSGGPVLDKRGGERVVACGINMRDMSLIDSNGTSGSGVRATCLALWPAMAITVEHAEIDGVTRPARLLELVTRGFVSDLGDPARHVKGVPDPGVTQFSIAWK
jgi:hypothetical protein